MANKTETHRFETHQWREYLKLHRDERASNWIIHSQGIIWTPTQKNENPNYKEYRAAVVSDDASVTIPEGSEKQVEIRSLPTPSNFYLYFFNANFDDDREAMEFMANHGLDHVGDWMVDAVSNSLLFTVDHLREYHYDFCETFLYFGLDGDVLSADLLSKEIGRAIRCRKNSRELKKHVKKRLFDKLHSGKIDITSKFKEQVEAAGGLKALWGKDARSYLDEINAHLKRCFLTFDYRKSGNTGTLAYLVEETPQDLIALAYRQLVKALSDEKQRGQFRLCPGCDNAFYTTKSAKKYCSLRCKKRIETRKHWAKIQSDPEKMEQHRQKSRASMKKYRDSLRD